MMSQKVTVQTTNFEIDDNQMDIINTQDLKLFTHKPYRFAQIHTDL